MTGSYPTGTDRTNPLFRPLPVYHLRPFLNSDPPRLAEIWRTQPPQRGLMQPASAALLDQLVFSRQYFDPNGLIVAVHDDVPVGFVHAGFGPSDDEESLSTEIGTTYLMMLREDQRPAELADELLLAAEAYLRGRGAKVIYAGGIRPLNGFYLGLYGGSELPGVLASSSVLIDVCRRNNYREVDRVIVLQRELGSFRPPITRTQRQLRRDTLIREDPAPAAGSWWNACTLGSFERSRFLLEAFAGGELLAEVSFWDIEPLSTAWGIVTSGIIDLQVSPARRRQGLATHLLGEAFTRMVGRGVARVEAQTMQTNLPALALYRKLGFSQVDEGVVFRKE
jgi:ribosomal protein S18 acetylase RimI-like enzyme